MENRHDIISRINEKYAAMSKGHKAIATYIMEHYDQAAFMTAAKLGAELGTSSFMWHIHRRSPVCSRTGI